MMTNVELGKTKRKIKVALVDDHTLFREGLKLALGSYSDLDIIYEANHGGELWEKLEEMEPDVIFMDINMPVMDGLTTTKKLKLHFPHIKVIAMTMYNEEKFIVKMIKNGANGYLDKNADYKELYEAINQVIAKDYYFNELMTKEMLKEWSISEKILLN